MLSEDSKEFRFYLHTLSSSDDVESADYHWFMVTLLEAIKRNSAIKIIDDFGYVTIGVLERGTVSAGELSLNIYDKYGVYKYGCILFKT